MERTGVCLADVGGMIEVKKRLEASFLAPMRNPELRQLYGKSLRGGLLLYGLPGTGKTFIARAIAGEMGAAFLSVMITDILGEYIGTSESNLHKAFQKARSHAPASFSSTRSTPSASSEHSYAARGCATPLVRDRSHRHRVRRFLRGVCGSARVDETAQHVMSHDAYSQEITRAARFVETGQYERAMQILTRLLAAYPDNANTTYKVMAEAHKSVERFEDAEAEARKALAALPNDPDAHRLLAQALISQDRDPEAERSLRTALELTPEDDSLLSLMSTALTRMGRTEEALFYAREAVRLSPGSAGNHLLLAMAQMTSNPQAAETALKETLALDPLFEEALLLRSWMLDDRGNHHDAAKALAAYTTQTSDYETSRHMVDAFLMKLASSASLGLWGAAILTMLLLPLVRTMNLPGSFLLPPLILAAIPTYQSTNSRIRAFRRAFTDRSRRILRSFIRTHRFLSLWAASAVVLWMGLVIGTVCAIRGTDAVLIIMAGASLGHLALGWIVLRIIPFIRRRNA